MLISELMFLLLDSIHGAQ